MKHIIKYGYKLFEQNINTFELYPLFIDNRKSVPFGEWIPAQIIMNHKGFSHRPGWHLGTIPSAPWLMSVDGTYKSQRGKNFRRVWALIQYQADIDYTDIVSSLPKKCFTDRLPSSGFYKFKESAGRDWIIADCIKIVKIIEEPQRQTHLKNLGYHEQNAFEPYKKAIEKRIKRRK